MQEAWSKHYEALPEIDFPSIQDGTFGEVKSMRRISDGETVIVKIARGEIQNSGEVQQDVFFDTLLNSNFKLQSLIAFSISRTTNRIKLVTRA